MTSSTIARAATTSDVFNAIAEPRRREILVLCEHCERPVTKLALPLGMTQPHASKHQRVLREVGLVRDRKAGNQRVYGLDARGLRPVFEWTGGFQQFRNESFDRLDACVHDLKEPTQKEGTVQGLVDPAKPIVIIVGGVRNAVAMETILVPPLLCSPKVYAPILDTVWSHGSVVLASTLYDETIADMAARILRNGPARFALLGTSMGGYVALEVMRQAPGRVAGLALVSTSARADSDEQLAARRRQSQLVEDGHFDALVDAAFPGLVAARNESNRYLLEAWRAMAATVGPSGFLRQQAATRDRRDSRDLLPGITCPTFVIHGAEDRLIPADVGIDIAAAVPTSTLRIVEDAGHFLFLERPDEADAIVNEFLEAVQASTP